MPLGKCGGVKVSSGEVVKLKAKYGGVGWMI